MAQSYRAIMTTDAFGTCLPLLDGKALPTNALRSLIIAITHLRLPPKSMLSLGLASVPVGLMRRIEDKNPRPG